VQLIVTAISKDYGNIAAVRQVSFQINSGDIFALLGPNGAGKSSIIRMLVGMTLPDSGSILVSHQDQYYDHVPRRLLGYLPEDRGLYPDKSIEKNLLYLAQLHGLTKQKALKEMTHWLEVFELTERRHEDLKQLSKGNQQKVQLIAAVLHRPALVILDEPFSGLDPLNQEKVVEFLKALKAQGMTVILSAHQMAMVEKLADHMLLMAQGKVILAGTLADIKQQAGLQRQMMISCTEPIALEQLQRWLPDLDIQAQSSTRFIIKLEPKHSVSASLKQLLNQLELTQVEMQAPDLHQLYLTAMANYQLKDQS
jgi:ABC-2 type transport system ATP-binding protein